MSGGGGGGNTGVRGTRHDSGTSRHPWLDLPAAGVVVHEDYQEAGDEKQVMNEDGDTDDASTRRDKYTTMKSAKTKTNTTRTATTATTTIESGTGAGGRSDPPSGNVRGRLEGVNLSEGDKHKDKDEDVDKDEDKDGSPPTSADDNRDVCVVIIGTLTRVDKTAEHNRKILDEVVKAAGAGALSHHFVGGSEIATSRQKRTYTTPKDDSSVNDTLRLVFPDTRFTSSVVPQRSYVSLWATQQKRVDACWNKLPPGQRFLDKRMTPVNSRQSLTLSTLGQAMSGASAPRCGWVIGYRSDFRFGSNFPETAKAFLFKPEHRNSWVNRAFHELVSRTDVFIASRATVAKLAGFDDFIWRKCPVDSRIRREGKARCALRSKSWNCMDLSASLERQLGQFLMDKKVKVVTPSAMQKGSILSKNKRRRSAL